MTMKRRMFLKGSLAAGTISVAVSAGLLAPGPVLAAWNKAAFDAKSVDDALQGVGLSGATESDDIKIKAPDIAENGAVVPITVSAGMDGAQAIAILASGNNVPLTSNYVLGNGAEIFVSTRVKMAKTGDVVAVVKAGDKVYMNKKEVKVTIGGCGG